MEKLLRDEKDVRLNDVMRACRKAAGHYRLSLDVLAQDRTAGVFKQMLESRSGLCRKIEALIRACGYLPETLDPDRQTVENLAERAKALISGDDRTAMLKHAVHLEDNLISCTGSVLSLSWPQAQSEQLYQIENEISRGKRILDSLIGPDNVDS